MVPSQPEPSLNAGSARAQKLLWLAFSLISVAYLIQVFTPLRLINDGVDYLLQASSAVDGNGFRVHGVHSMRPPGYPALIFVLAKAGVGYSWAIVALNCISLGIGCWATYFVLRDSFGFTANVSRIICLLTLLSFVMVRNATYPLSDVCFFGASVPCLLALIRSENLDWKKRLWRIALLVLPILFAIELRTIGICLLPGLVWVAIGGLPGARKMGSIAWRHRVVTFILLVVVMMLVGKAFLSSRYMAFNLPTFQHRGVLRSVAANLRDHTAEWGELTFNAPISKLPGFLARPLHAVGGVAIVLFVVGLWQKGKRPDPVWFYVIGSAAIVFAYPWFDTRLWLPVLPFLMGYVWMAFGRAYPPQAVRLAGPAYCVLYALLGIAALGYSTRLTFSGTQFPELFGDGNFRATYRFALRGEAPSDPKQIDPDALYLLHRYEWRASGK